MRQITVDLLLTARLCSCPLTICFAELTFAKLPPPITLPRVTPTFVSSLLASSLGLLLAISSVPSRTTVVAQLVITRAWGKSAFCLPQEDAAGKN